jgi:hypothetical protein
VAAAVLGGSVTSPRQPTVEGERLRRDVADARSKTVDQVKREIPIGTLVLRMGLEESPGDGWHRANGTVWLLRTQYPHTTRYLSEIPVASIDAAVLVPSVSAPPGGFASWWMWGPS